MQEKKEKMNSQQIFMPFQDKNQNELIRNIWEGDTERLFSW